MAIPDPLKFQVDGDVSGTNRADGAAAARVSVASSPPSLESAELYWWLSSMSMACSWMPIPRGWDRGAKNAVSLFRERLDAIQVQSARAGRGLADPFARRERHRDRHHVARSSEFSPPHGVPVVACLMDVATGGAYYLATGSDVIIAHPTGVTGAIGCILNVYNLQDLMAQFNIVGIPVKAGKNIDLGSPIKALDPEGRKVLQAMADEFHRRFREVVMQGAPESRSALGNDVRRPGVHGLAGRDLGLIDEIGYLDDAVARARDLAGISRSALRSFSITARATPPFAVFRHSQRSLAGQTDSRQCSGVESFATSEFPLLVGDGSHGRSHHGKIEHENVVLASVSERRE